MEKLKRKLEPELKENIADFFKKEANVKLAYIFGSYGTKYQNTDSDLDLAVLFDDPPDMSEQMELAACLELELGKYDIDLINLNNVKLAFKYEVVRSGELIYSRDEIETAEFKEEFLKFGPEAEEIKYNLQAAVEAMLDIAAHIISREGYTGPATSADSFRILAAEGIIQENLLLKFVKMTKFRNRIVHLYDQIDEEYIYQIIKNNLSDIESFVDLIVNRYF
jgi:uncharacterized protein YutE (UPF0331/DUF86 family)